MEYQLPRSSIPRNIRFPIRPESVRGAFQRVCLTGIMRWKKVYPSRFVVRSAVVPTIDTPRQITTTPVHCSG